MGVCPHPRKKVSHDVHAVKPLFPGSQGGRPYCSRCFCRSSPHTSAPKPCSSALPLVPLPRAESWSVAPSSGPCTCTRLPGDCHAWAHPRPVDLPTNPNTAPFFPTTFGLTLRRDTRDPECSRILTVAIAYTTSPRQPATFAVRVCMCVCMHKGNPIPPSYHPQTPTARRQYPLHLPASATPRFALDLPLLSAPRALPVFV